MQVDEETDRPTDAATIMGVEVLWNPFEDIVPPTNCMHANSLTKLTSAAVCASTMQVDEETDRPTEPPIITSVDA
jgi:hypothetical protein